MITAARAETLFQSLSDARSAANQGNTNAVTLKLARDGSFRGAYTVARRSNRHAICSGMAVRLSRHRGVC